MGFVNNTCIFCQRPDDCKFWEELGKEGCTADDWYLIQCLLDHYGNELKPDAGLRLANTFVCLVMANDKEMNGPGAYDLPPALKFGVRGWRG